jgi:hypothetical protein
MLNGGVYAVELSTAEVERSSARTALVDIVVPVPVPVPDPQ